jgi:hypothetical protein
VTNIAAQGCTISPLHLPICTIEGSGRNGFWGANGETEGIKTGQIIQSCLTPRCNAHHDVIRILPQEMEAVCRSKSFAKIQNLGICFTGFDQMESEYSQQ